MTPSSRDKAPQNSAPLKDGQSKRPYQRPTVKRMDESEVLATFQITSAFASWWW